MILGGICLAQPTVLLERAAPRRKAEPAGLDLGRIVRTAVRMLDEEGLARFSMRGLAAELGFTPMSVYW